MNKKEQLICVDPCIKQQMQAMTNSWPEKIVVAQLELLVKDEMVIVVEGMYQLP